MAFSQVRSVILGIGVTLLGCASNNPSDTGVKPESSTVADDRSSGSTAGHSGNGTGGTSADDTHHSGGGSSHTGSAGTNTGTGMTGGSAGNTGGPAGNTGDDPPVDPPPDAGPATDFDSGMVAPIDAGTDSGPEVVDASPSPMIGPDLGTAELADADRAALIFELLQAEDYVDNWFPVLQSNGEQRALLLTPSHGSQVRVRQNAIAKQAMDAWVAQRMPLPLEMPNGSIFVKDMYKLDTSTGLYAFNGGLVMAKIAVLDTAQYEGKWFFVRISSANVPSRGTTCVNCHNGRGNKTVWLPDPKVMNDPGGRVDALVSYDYLYIPFCYDIRTPECTAPP